MCSIVKDYNTPLRLVSYTEVFYASTVSNPTRDIRTYPHLNIYSINNFVKYTTNSTYYDFNFLLSLLNSKEQRWLVKNSLLTEFLINNSFLFTQSKQLIGLNSSDKDLSKQNLWLSSKLSTFSLLETKSYLNNISTSTYTDLVHNHPKFLNNPNINQSNLSNLNFFENSRFWVFKKYFFNNSAANNLITKDISNYDSKQTSYLNSYAYSNYSSLGLLTKISSTTNNYYSLSATNPSDTRYKPRTISSNSKPLDTNNLNILLNLNNLDLLEGLNTSFLYLLTSNIQSPHLQYNTPYFNGLNYPTNTNKTTILYKHVN